MRTFTPRDRTGKLMAHPVKYHPLPVIVDRAALVFALHRAVRADGTVDPKGLWTVSDPISGAVVTRVDSYYSPALGVPVDGRTLNRRQSQMEAYNRVAHLIKKVGEEAFYKRVVAVRAKYGPAADFVREAVAAGYSEA